MLAGHTVYQAVGDADTDIIRAALDSLSSGKITTVVADDTDILVLLVYHVKPTMSDTYMLKTATGKKKESKLVSIKNIQTEIGSTAVRQLLLIHALSGCDTTSALFGIG